MPERMRHQRILQEELIDETSRCIKRAATCREPEEVSTMTIHERAEALKKKLAAMGITSDAELQKALEETRIDIAPFVSKPQHDGEKIA